jgi:hypothetical protein
VIVQVLEMVKAKVGGGPIYIEALEEVVGAELINFTPNNTIRPS